MEKVLRRAMLAEKQAHRRTKKVIEKNIREKLKTQREQDRVRQRMLTDRIKQAKIERREDWELGPIAPRRDVGDKIDTYGTVDSSQSKGPILRTREKYEALKSVGGIFLTLRKDDRVVLIEGRDMGKIGRIKSTDSKRAECTVEGLNMIDVQVPNYMISKDDPDQRPIRSIEKPVPLNSVRLVYPLPDPETGIERDVIIKKLVNGPMYYNRHTGIRRWRRYVPGLNVTIPWPVIERKEHKVGPDDTIRVDLDQHTFVPTLTRPPMPASVIDELRNKFSKFRTRHEPEYIAAKMEEDRVAAEKKKMNTVMRTPLNEANRKERKERKALGKGKLTPDMMMRIGQMIAVRRAGGMNGIVPEKAAPVPMTA